MSQWIANNWLALYGSIVGTIALFINLSGFIHTLRKDIVKLKVFIEPHPRRHENIKALKNQENKDGPGKIHGVEVYYINVSNIGNVTAYIDDVGLICKKGQEKYAYALTPTRISNASILNRVSDTSTDPIPSKSSKRFTVCLHHDEEPFEAKQAFVIDNTGKKWRVNA